MDTKKISIGTCGWSRIPEKGDKLLNYVNKFDIVEVNSTFYKLPMEKTAKRWRQKADTVKQTFEFIVKAHKTITHIDKFKTEKSIEAFNKTKEIAKALRSKVILLQTPKSFKPTKENIENAKKFFNSIDREEFSIVWEVRWKDEWKKEIVEPLFSMLDISQAVDPLRQTFSAGEIAYFRLHGFGERMMYFYKFSDEELIKIKIRIEEELKKKKKVYVLFNNTYMYEDAYRLIDLMKI